jgi:hypothetical protein
MMTETENIGSQQNSQVPERFKRKAFAGRRLPVDQHVRQPVLGSVRIRQIHPVGRARPPVRPRSVQKPVQTTFSFF